MKIEQVNDADTPEEMRAEIARLRRYDSTVCRVMDTADFRGLSGEDRYTMLAYYALKALSMTQQNLLDAMKEQRK